MRGSGQVAACFFGDRALGQGLLYETMNRAALWKLPVIYVCENNLYAIHTSARPSPARSWARARRLRHPRRERRRPGRASGQRDDAPVVEARAAAKAGVPRVQTYRYYGHHVGDVNREYRTREEEREWMTTHDPLQTLPGGSPTRGSPTRASSSASATT